MKYYNVEDSNNWCVKGHLLNYYLDKTNPSNLTWKKCDESCLTCENHAKNCLECNEANNFYKLDFKQLNISITQNLNNLTYEEYLNLNFICLKIDNKINTIFFDKENKNYDKCNKDCNICENKTSCINCNTDNGYFFKENDNTGIYLLLKFYYDILIKKFIFFIFINFDYNFIRMHI